MRKLLPLCAIVVLALLTNSNAGSISGQLLDPRGLPQPGITTTCNIYGTNQYGYASKVTTANTDPSLAGLFKLAPLIGSGTFCQAFAEKDGLPLLYRSGLVIPSGSDAPYATIRYRLASYCFPTGPFAGPHEDYAQSFRATGSSVISVSVRCMSPVSGNIDVSILDGEMPDSPQVGPSRTVAISGTSVQTAWWNADDVPTVPGRIYTARFRLVGGGGLDLLANTVRDRMSAPNPDGHTWLDGALSDQPLAMTVNMNDSGLLDTLCLMDCPSYSISSAGAQTFTAKGTGLVAVSWTAINTAKLAVSIHDGPGTFGQGGTQIGPTKYADVSPLAARSAVTFAPGEVPTVPGHVYYIKIATTTGATFRLYSAGTDVYAGGTAYIASQAKDYDFSLGIYEEPSAGAASAAAVGIRNLRVESISADSAVVRWDTTAESDTTLDYGPGTPYIGSYYDSSPVTSHSAPLMGLEANTMYHVRATSRATGFREERSDDVVFVTTADQPNLLADPGFESGALGAWTAYGTGIGPVAAGGHDGIGPHTGAWGVGGSVEHGAARGGVYQRVACSPGLDCRLSTWAYSYCEGDFYSSGSQTTLRIGIDPTGGTDPGSPAVHWAPLTNSQSAWTPIGVSATSAADHVTVFLEGGCDSECSVSALVFDDVVLTGQRAQPVGLPLVDAVGSCADGSFISIENVVCSAVGVDGACYVQTADRAAGLRVETADAMTIGDRLTLAGTMQTKTSTQRYLSGASVMSRISGTAPSPICARTASLGGTSRGEYCAPVPGTTGPYNVGLLMRVCGRVESTSSGFAVVNDGSGAGRVKVSTANLTSGLNQGQMVGVTGIVSLEGEVGSASVILLPRNDGDVQTY